MLFRYASHRVAVVFCRIRNAFETNTPRVHSTCYVNSPTEKKGETKEISEEAEGVTEAIGVIGAVEALEGAANAARSNALRVAHEMAARSSRYIESKRITYKLL